MKLIAVGKGLFAQVDDQDFERLSQFKWSLNKGYVVTSIRCSWLRRGKYQETMHRMILGLEYGDKREGDHRDTNKLNNQRYNLRICTRGQNVKNVAMRKDNTSGYKGVSFKKSNGKWGASIMINGKAKHLGYYPTPEEAHEVYCLWADMLHGEFANHGTPKTIVSRVNSGDVYADFQLEAA